MARKKDANTKAPSHLTTATREWYAQVVADYELEQHHLRLLRLACEAWDRSQQARQAIKKHGLTFTDRFGSPRARPEVKMEQENRTSFARLLRELDIDADPPAEGKRPPALKSNRGE